MKHRILTLLLAACALALPALAAPDLSGKSPAFVAAYNAAYAQCITNGKRTSTVRKKPTEIAACEQNAFSSAQAATTQPTTTLRDKVSVPGTGLIPNPELPTGSMDTPAIVLTKAKIDEMNKNMDPNRMVLTIPIDFQNLPTQFPDTVPDSSRPQKIWINIYMVGKSQGPDNKWTYVQNRDARLWTELDYPTDGNLQTVLKLPLEGPESLFEGLDFRFFGNSDRHRIDVTIHAGVRDQTGTSSDVSSFESSWDYPGSIFRFANATWVIFGQFEKGGWVRLHRGWSGPTPDEFTTATSECDEEANAYTRSGSAVLYLNGQTAHSCEAIAQ